MWFSLFATVLILAIVFYEGLQGLFTALINCVLAIMAASLAFGLYEDLYFNFLKDHQPDHGRAIALLSIFIVSLLVLRTLFDIFIKGNLQFPVYVDRAGGGLFGFITGMIIVGMLSIGFEMLPFGNTVLSFARLSLVDTSTNQPVSDAELAEVNPADLEYVRQSPWLRQDDFTVSLVSHLSANSLRGRNQLGDVYPDFTAHAYRSRARLGDDMQPTASGSMEVEGYWVLKPNEFNTRERLNKQDRKKITPVPTKASPAPGHERIGVRVSFRFRSAQDVDKLNFTPEQVRLVARDGRSGQVSEHLLIGINEPKAANKLIKLWAAELLQRSLDSKNNKLELVFEVPTGIELDEGSFIEVKQNLRASVTQEDKLDKPRPGALAGAGGSRANGRPSAESGTQSSSRSPGNGGGSTSRRPQGVSNVSSPDHDRVSGIGPAREALVSDQLPFKRPLTQYGGTAQVSGGAIQGGRVVAPLTDDWQPLEGGDEAPIERIQVPSDMRLIQVSVEKLQPGSVLGKAMGFARDNIADYKLYDQRGEAHLPVGMYGIAKVGGKPTFELILLDDIARQDDAVFAKLPPFERIKRQDFKDDYALYFIYQVKSGTRATKIYTGRTDVNLEKFNLVAE